jgi:HAE1 family hydrophobic/amphiphilic exporter-1
MNLPAASIRRPVTVLMGTLIAVLLGVISFLKLPIDLMPEIVYPTISVRAEYPGVAPEEMENLVARPLEEALSSAPGVKEITSSSSEGSANVRVAFEHGVTWTKPRTNCGAALTGGGPHCQRTWSPR